MTTRKEPMVTFGRDGKVGLVTLNRPERLNAFMPEMIRDWNIALGAAVADAKVNVILLSGEGRAFCAGGDADDIRQRKTETLERRRAYYAAEIHAIARTMHATDKPLIAAIQGSARGAGLDMALMCDLRICGESASFGESYVNLGLIAGAGGTYVLPRLVGMARALELFWTARVVGAQEAERIGMVNRVVPDDRLVPEARRLAQDIAAKPQEAVRMFRRASYEGMNMSLDAHLEMLASHMAYLHGTPDHARLVEGMLPRPRSQKARSAGGKTAARPVRAGRAMKQTTKRTAR